MSAFRHFDNSRGGHGPSSGRKFGQGKSGGGSYGRSGGYGSSSRGRGQFGGTKSGDSGSFYWKRRSADRSFDTRGEGARSAYGRRGMGSEADDFFGDEPLDRETAQALAIKEKRRKKALQEAQAPVSSEQEAALKSIALFLEENRELWAGQENWLFLRAHYSPELFYADPQSGLAKFVFSPSGKLTCEQSSARAYHFLAEHALKAKDRLHRNGKECLLWAGYGEEVPAPEIVLKQPWDEDVLAGNEQGKEGGQASSSCHRPELYDVAIILGTSSRAENYVNFVRALRSVRPGGWLIFSIANSLGAGSFEKAMAKFAPLAAQLSKFHCRTFAIQIPQPADIAADASKRALEQEWDEGFKYRFCEDSGLLTRPGIFSWNKADGGSRLLGEYLRDKADLEGVGADLGSANGYLAKAVLESKSQAAKKITRLDLFEDEYMALAAAKLLFKDVKPGFPIGYNWADVISDLPSEQYDFIVMNPPFHQGQTRVINLGREFVASASRALSWRGVLYVVVNRTLPYEETLEAYFQTYEKVAENNGFKVFKASKPLAAMASRGFKR